jgi:hypothetical protein
MSLGFSIGWYVMGCRSIVETWIDHDRNAAWPDWYVTYLVDGKQGATLHRVVSGDGKTMRETSTANFQGRPVESLQIFQRQ